MTSKSCCDEAIEQGTLIRKGRAEWVCPTCGKDQMLKLVFMHDAGLEYKPGKGLKRSNHIAAVSKIVGQN